MSIDFNNNTPIYLQLLESVKTSIIKGELKCGDKLPSVREYANMYKVNPNTMQKALIELEDLKLIYTERTNGKYVTKDSKIIEKMKEDYAKKIIDNYFDSNTFDIITCNPPYFKTKENGYRNKNDFLSLARHEIAINLETIFKIVSKYLKSNKAFYLVHRVERLDDIIVLARENKLNVKELQFISTKKEKSANTILIKCVKNSKPGIKLRKEICVDNLDTYQHLFESEVF